MNNGAPIQLSKRELSNRKFNSDCSLFPFVLQSGGYSALPALRRR